MNAPAPNPTLRRRGARGRAGLTPAGLALLLGITAVAAFLRFFRLSWGLEDGVIFPDEWVWWRRGSAFVPLTCASFEAIGLPQFPYPTLYGYLTGALTALAAALGAIEPPSQRLVPDLAVVGIARASRPRRGSAPRSRRGCSARASTPGRSASPQPR